MGSTLALDPDVVVVEVDGTTVAYVPARRELLALGPEATSVLAAITAADPQLVPASNALAVAEQLVELGILCEDTPA